MSGLSRRAMTNLPTLSLSIGALSQATGVPVNTLRTWERRYGVPSGDRTSGGHRLYPPETVEHLRLVVRALDAGHRPAQVLPASVEDLRRLVGQAGPSASPAGPVEAWVDAARALDGTALVRGFAEEGARLGLPAFLELRALPFLRRVGEAWEAGEIQVFHEHFASARLEDFLSAWWRPLADGATGRAVVCSTLAGDHHNLGLHMAAGLLAVAGHRVVFLGPDTPVDDIVAATAQAQARDVVVSVSFSVPSPHGGISALRAALPARVRLYVGGAGSEDIEGVVRVPRLSRLAEMMNT
jgi:hypothetical protein